MFIYAFIHLHINILKPLQCLNSILRQLFCINFSTRIKSSQFTSHSTCFFRYTCIYIYTISNQHFKAFTVSTVTTSTGLCATCTRQETRMSFFVLTSTRASFQVLTCLAWLVWREYLARQASIDTSFFVASSEASQRCNSHPPDRQLAHETRASLRVFPLRVVLVSIVTVSKLY